MGDYRSLKAWQHAHELALEVYRVTSRYPKHEVYALTSQTRRSAASIPTNLAEGAGRNSQRELARFARISLGSGSELDYQLLLARDLGYLSEDEHAALAEKVDHLRRMLANFIRAVATDNG